MGRIYVLCMLSLITLLGACINVSSTPPVRSNVSLPPVISLSINPSEVGAGSPTTLQWNVTGANSVTIDKGIGTVANSGIKTVIPKVDSSYTLTAINSAGKSTKSVTVTVKSVTMSLSTSLRLKEKPSIPSATTAKPGIGELVVRVPPKFTYKTYTETLYDFVKQAPTAAWSENSMSGEPGYWEDIPFPSSGPRTLKYWDNIILEGGSTYKESLYIKLRQGWDGNNKKYFNTALTGDYPVSIPMNSWFTAKIGFPAMANPPENKPLIKFWVNYSPIGVPPENYCYSLTITHTVSYDNYVDQVDIDLSKEYGGILCGTTGYVTFIIINDPDPEMNLPVVITDAKIAR